MTRILHTSDWHLGATLEGASRDEEHERFLAWLETTLANERVEVLVIAGDVFDQSQPSAEAQRMYYRFLHRVGLGGLVRKVVVVGGNHDSASRLDAPAELLAGLDVHVVGGLQADPSTWDRCLCPLRNQRGEIDAVVAAVPFVHEYRLGVRTVLREPAEVRASFRQEFSRLYRELTDRALTMSNGAPVIATGHLACTAQGASLEKGDTPFEVHMIGLIGALDPAIFDPRIAYVALGHIHRSYRVGDSAAWYSGTPVPMSLAEAGSGKRKVLIAEVGRSEPASVRAIEVPRWRGVVEVAGAPSEVGPKLASLSWSEDLPPLVFVTVEVEAHLPGIEAQVRTAFESNPRKGAKLLRVQEKLRAGREATEATSEPGEVLRDLAPEDVFRRLCAEHRVEVDTDLLAAFHTLIAEASQGQVRS